MLPSIFLAFQALDALSLRFFHFEHWAVPRCAPGICGPTAILRNPQVFKDLSLKKKKAHIACDSGTWASKLLDQLRLGSEAPLASARRPTTTAATAGRATGIRLAEVRHIHRRVRKVHSNVNPYVTSKIRCVASGGWIHRFRELREY